MAKNLINYFDDNEEEVELFEKLNKSNKPKFNPNHDTKEKIKQQRRQRQKMRDNAYKEEEEFDV